MSCYKRFSTPIWQLPNSEEPTEALDWALRLKDKYPSRTISNRGGYQSPSFHIDEFKYAKHVRAGISCIFPYYLIQNWWVNINMKGDYNLSHSHPNTDIAAIWYLTDNHGKLILEDPCIHTRFNLYEFFEKKGVKDHNKSVNVTAKAGEIVMFPADVRHFVEPHDSDSPRVCVSMNLTLISEEEWISMKKMDERIEKMENKELQKEIRDASLTDPQNSAIFTKS